ncbi:MAG TPA: hypothetical protein VMH77_01225 [Steroidobacteraceae bacterium]|nr:hypothetical protein [Steroidobacteraceae bacterium]
MFSLWIANYVKTFCSRSLRRHRAMVYQRASDTLPPVIGFNKERIQLAVSILAWKNGGETPDNTILLRHEDPAIRDRLDRQHHRLWMCEQRSAVHWILQGSTPLKIFEGGVLRGDCQANLDP